MTFALRDAENAITSFFPPWTRNRVLGGSAYALGIVAKVAIPGARVYLKG